MGKNDQPSKIVSSGLTYVLGVPKGKKQTNKPTDRQVVKEITFEEIKIKNVQNWWNTKIKETQWALSGAEITKIMPRHSLIKVSENQQ